MKNETNFLHIFNNPRLPYMNKRVNKHNILIILSTQMDTQLTVTLLNRVTN